MKDNYTIGINFLHSDTAACIFKNNNLIAASEEERFTRVKHTSTFPFNAIKFCLKEANISLSDVDNITINSNPYNSILRKIFFVLKNPSSYEIFFQSLKNKKNKLSLKYYISKIDTLNKFRGKIRYIDHHESHIASSSNFSGFEKSINVSVDGFGDFASCAWGTKINDLYSLKNKIYFPHSLGIFYQSMTQFLGFKSYGDEYKVMGLSPYGKPKYVNEISKLINKTKNGFELNLKYFLHHKKKIFNVNDIGQFVYKNLYSTKLNELIDFERDPSDKITQVHMDIAKSTQTVYENIFFHILNLAQKENKDIHNLTLSGGCAMNSVANGKIIRNTKFKNIYFNPNPGDAGGSVGSSSLFLKRNFNYSFEHLNYGYLGCSFKNENIKEIISNNKIDKKFKVKYLKYDEIYRLVVKLLISENIIGWFQDRMEWGPRALGNRSILADARNPNIKEIINKKIKRRESFRPFAPSILIEKVNEWFEIDRNVPFMSEVYPIKENKRSIIPGVTHVDGTGRLQTVDEMNNRKYYNLIKCFYKSTEVPIILNTSFNENEPIVNNPIEAIKCFERTNMDALVLQNWFISRNEI